MFSYFPLPFSCYYNILSCFLFINICTSSLYSSTTAISYSDHCSFIVPESIPTVRSYINYPPLLVTNHYTGGDKLLHRKPSQKPSHYVTKSLRLKTTPNYYKTNASGVYKVEANLYIRSPYRYQWIGPGPPDPVTFLLNRFWSEFSRKLCMVGSASWQSEEGETVDVDAILKVVFPNENSSIFTSFVSGVLESTKSVDDSKYFDPLLIYSFPVLSNYSYSLGLKEFFGENDIAKNKSVDLQPESFCSMLSGRYLFFELEYDLECFTLGNCSPLGGGYYRNLPTFMSLDLIQCLGDERKVRYVVKFQNITCGVFYQDFDVDRTLIGEGMWDEKTNRLLMVACRISNRVNNLDKNFDKECNTRLSLRYPSIWNITNDAKIVGQIWTNNNTVNDSGFFRRIKFSSSDENDMVVFPGLRYEYTELARVKKLCPRKSKTLVKNARNVYPNGHSNDMKYDIRVSNYKGKVFAWGDAMPLYVGNDFYQKPAKNEATLLNMSYKIGIRPMRKVEYGYWFPTLDWSMNLRSRVEITAEGVYDVETGHLCMVGCRKLLSYNLKLSNYSKTDCEIVVKIEFAPMNEKRGLGLIKGSIKSMREKVDPLYFEDLGLLSTAFYRSSAKKVVSRMDLEVVMVLISSTFVCVFVGSQLIHVKMNPEVLSSISVVMIVILCFGHVVPIVLNYETLFSRTRKKVIVRVVNMLALLLIIRLLQLVWVARLEDGDEKGEKKAGLVLLLKYIFGGLIALEMNRARIEKYSVWVNLSAFCGLVLDWFLLPQVLLNVFRGSEEMALSGLFYIGISGVRLMSRGYDYYRIRHYPSFDVNWTYYYGNRGVGLYSTGWDMVVTWGIVVLVVVITLQQWFGGRCIIPGYERVPEVNNEG